MYKDVNIDKHILSPAASTLAEVMKPVYALVMLWSTCMLTFAYAQQPSIMLDFPGASIDDMIKICLQQDEEVMIVGDEDTGDVILSAVAARADLGCPAEPGPDPVINNFVVSSVPVDPLDIDGTVNTFLDTSSSNCDPDQDPMTEDICLYVTWDVTPSTVDGMSCIVEQVDQTNDDMTPPAFGNPGDFIGSPSEFVDFRPNQLWPLDNAAGLISNGDRTFQMTCRNSPKDVAVLSQPQTVTFSDGITGVRIEEFTIDQLDAEQGSIIGFNWQVTSLGGAAINCTMSSMTPGVINPVTMITTASGSDTAQIFDDSPTGDQIFVFDCQDRIGDTMSVLVNIEPSSGVQCPQPPMNRDTRETTFVGQFDPPQNSWPGNSGNNTNVGVLRGQYKALRFDTSPGGDTFIAGEYQFGKSTSGLASSTVTISECAGDFGDASGFPPLGDFCKFEGVSGALKWAFSETGVADRCLLERDRTYFLNVRFPLCPATESQCFHLNTIQNIPL